MNKIYTLIINSIIAKDTPNGTVFKLRFYVKNNNTYVYDTIQAASIRLSFFLAAADSKNIKDTLGKSVKATIVTRCGLNKLDNKPYSHLIVNKYIGGANNE